MSPRRRSRQPVKVLYLLGRGRSGTTAFGNVLGEHQGFFCAGELRYLWDPVVKNDGLCACRQKVSVCAVWSRVLDRLDDVVVDDVGEWQREVVTERNLLRLLRYRPERRWAALERFASVMQRVYQALAEVTGASVIVDSSKRPSYAAVVRLLQGCDLYCVQMIRDPRASAYSWATRRHPSAFGVGSEVKRRGAFDSTVRWDVLNLEAELLSRRLPPDRKMKLRYEDFATNARGTLAEILGFVRQNHVASPFIDERTLFLRPNHTVAGNPSRFRAGETRIEDKREWRTQQKTTDAFVATLVGLPYLRRYGYPLRVGRAKLERPKAGQAASVAPVSAPFCSRG